MTVLLLWALLGSPAVAGVISDGNAAFEQGDLDGAITAWEAAVDRGAPSGRVLFDLGNAWYRKGDWPRAVAYYREAERLRPRDGDVQHNLALARSELSGVPDPVGARPSWTAVLTAGELALLGLFTSLFGTAGALSWRRRGGRARAWAAAGVLALGLAMSAAALSASRTGGVVVVVDRDAVARDAPDPAGGEQFRLPPGSEVGVVRTLGDFHLVEDARARRGWVSRSSVLP